MQENRKYRLSRESIIHKGVVFHRIIAKIDIPWHHVRKGDMGGFVEAGGKLPLCETGHCWIGGNAKVSKCAFINGNALVTDNAFIGNYVRITDYAIVKDNAIIGGNVTIEDQVYIMGAPKIFGNLTLKDFVVIRDKAEIHAKIGYISGSSTIRHGAKLNGEFELNDNIIIEEDANINGKVLLTGRVRVSSKAIIHGNVSIRGSYRITDSAFIHGKYKAGKEIYIFGTGRIDGNATIVKHGRKYWNLHISNDSLISNLRLSLNNLMNKI
jgi:UDP-3-O-[3-hydroxymyristoyl] glucosamine N-acyltransferase